MIVLAFDFGEKRIGAAVGDALTGTARPLPALTTGDWPALQRCVTEWGPAALVVGLPLDEAGSDQAITLRARQFAQQLQARCKLPVHTSDERYSSRVADERLREARASGRMTRRVRKGDRDGEAARVILEQWFQENGGDRS